MRHVWWGVAILGGRMLIAVFKYGLTDKAAFCLAFLIPIALLVSYYVYKSEY
jgi:hypothetical protein